MLKPEKMAPICSGKTYFLRPVSSYFAKFSAGWQQWAPQQCWDVSKFFLPFS
jgi:hypothetical protein